MDFDDIPPLHKAIPADHHPAVLLRKGARDDIPTRAGVSGLSALYGTWAKLADLEIQLTNKAKLHDLAGREMVAALAKSEGVVKHLTSLEKTHTDAIRNKIVAGRTRYDAELRAHYKGKPGDALRDAPSNPEIAAALYDVPAVLLGFTDEQAALLRDQIEQGVTPGDYATRASARTAAAKLEAARERFSATYQKKLSAWESSDDKILAAAGKVA